MSRASAEKVRGMLKPPIEVDRGSGGGRSSAAGKGTRGGGSGGMRTGGDKFWRGRSLSVTESVVESEGEQEVSMEVSSQGMEQEAMGGGGNVETPRGGRGANEVDIGDLEGNGKRKERSPTMAEESERRRRRLNEFEIGKLFEKIEEGMRSKVEEVVAKAPDGLKETLKEGMGAVMNAMVELMNGLSDGLTEQRRGREILELKVEDRLERLEEKVKDVTETTDGLTELRIKSRDSESVKEMERKVSEAMCMIKVMNIDIGRETQDKREIVRRTLEVTRSYVADRDKGWFDSVIKKTRVIILGKGTRRWDRGGTSEYCVPTLFQCRNRGDCESLEEILRGAGYHPTFHWPSEMLEFIWGVKDVVRKTGVDEKVNFFKVRPEIRDGRVQVKLEVKAKEGGVRFTLKGIWGCPPVHRHLWDSFPDLFKPKVVPGGGG